MPNIRNPIQRFFWDNLTRGGLDLVDGSRVDQLLEYAKKNKITEAAATPNAAGAREEVDSFETAELKGLLDHAEWRSLLTDDGVRRLETILNVRVDPAHPGRGVDALGAVPQGSVRGNLTNMIGSRVKLEHTAELFKHEYAQRKAQLFENPRMPEEERGKQLLFLLQDYAKVLNGAGGGPQVAKEREEILKAFFESPVAKVYGGADPDDDLLTTAWETVWGTNPEKAEGKFAIDKGKSWTAYMSMSGEFRETAKKLDAYLKAANGDGPKISMYENKSPLNWIIGEETGNVKPSSTFAESSAIRSTGVDFASKLLPSTRELGDRVLEPTFDLKVDFYAWGNFVSLNTRAGEKLVAVHDTTREALKVEVETVGDAHWRPVFKNAAGAVVPPGEVTAVIHDRAGNVKGDGAANGSYSASWWGFCDRNAMMGLVTMKYGFPKPTKDVTLKVGSEEFKFTAADIALMTGRRLTELFPETTQAGNRYDEEPDQVHLADGTMLAGKISDPVNFYQEHTYRIGDNMVVTPKDPGAPQGSLLIATAAGEKDVSAADVVEAHRLPQQPGSRELEVKLVLKDGTETTGTLKSKLAFDGAERRPDGTLILKSTAEAPIRGDLKMTTERGEARRVALADITYLVREDINEVLAEDALAYIIRNQGIFAADSWTHSSVANGTRTIDSITRWSVSDTDKPSWVPTDLANLEGVKGKVKDPANLMFFHMGNEGSSYGGIKFWMEVDANKNVINTKIIDGQWDFLWGVEGKPDWNAAPTFNKHVPNDLVAKLYVNSIENPEAVKDVLPDNWRSLLIQ